MNSKNVLLGILGISLVVAVHELGHWSMCQLFNVGTPRFSVGFGPVIFEKKIGSTIWSISALPLGGYVEIAGMRSSVPGNASQSFINKTFFQKTLIMLGGIFFNIIFAFIVFFIVGFRPKKLLSADQESEPKSISENESSTQNQAQIIGPLGIIALASHSSRYGIKFYFFFLAILSLNLALFNLLPLPILDGGQLLIQTIEALKGQQIQPSSYHLIMSVTIIFVIAALIYATARDITRKSP